MIYADFKSILVQEHNGKQNLEESYTNKIKNGYKLVCVQLVSV